MMFRHRAVPYLKGLSEGVIVSRTVKTFGIGESAAEALLRDLMNSLHNPTLAPYAKPTGTELRVTAHARTEAEALARITPVVDQVKALLGDKVIGVDVSCLEEVCYGLLKERGLTVGTAESCTGGLLAKLLTDLPGSSALFRGGIVSYTNAVKAGVLGVPQTLLDQYGAVSPQVAEAMARGAKAVLGCDIALSTTGRGPARSRTTGAIPSGPGLPGPGLGRAVPGGSPSRRSGGPGPDSPAGRQTRPGPAAPAFNGAVSPRLLCTTGAGTPRCPSSCSRYFLPFRR